MCDAFTRMDLEAALKAVAPRAEVKDGGDLDKAISRIEKNCEISTVIDALEIARTALDQDEPDGEIVLAATDCVVRAIEVAEELRDTMCNQEEALRSVYDEVAESDRVGVDVEDLIAELEYRGYQIVKVPRNVVQVKARTSRRHAPRLRKVA